MRFLLEIVRRIRARVAPGFAVAVKLNSADFQRGGFSEDDSRHVIAALAGEGLDLIEISGGSYESPAMSGSVASSTREREAYFLDYARTVRQITAGVPLAVTGGFRSRRAIREALDAGDCDVVGMARPTVITPDAATAILSDRLDVLPTHELHYGMRGLLGRFVDLKSFDGLLNLSWNADQIHRLGAGKQPDLDRGRLATTVAMLLPITAKVDITASMIFFAGIYYGAMYGGSTTSILLNTPGEAGSMVTAMEGNKMAKNGRAGAALATAAIGSFVAGTIATVLVTLFAPLVAEYAVRLGPPEYFLLMVLAGGRLWCQAIALTSVLKLI